MKRTIESVRRRQLVIAGLVAGAMPATAVAGRCGAAAHAFGVSEVTAVSTAAGDRLVVSGRVVDASCNAIAGARVELTGIGTHATTDADGRFMVTANRVRAASPSMHIRVSHGKTRASHHVLVRHDEGGSWRGTLEIALT